MTFEIGEKIVIFAKNSQAIFHCNPISQTHKKIPDKIKFIGTQESYPQNIPQLKQYLNEFQLAKIIIIEAK